MLSAQNQEIKLSFSPLKMIGLTFLWQDCVGDAALTDLGNLNYVHFFMLAKGCSLNVMFFLKIL